MKRRITSILIACIMIASLPLYGFAEETNTIEIKSGDLSTSINWEKQVNEIGEEILTQLNAKPVDEYETVIAKASIDNMEAIENIYDEVIIDAIINDDKSAVDNIKKASNANIPSVVIDEDAYQQLTSTFVISDVAVFEITPLYIALEVVGSNSDGSDCSQTYSDATENMGEKAASKKSTNGYSTKVYYSGGTKIATSKVNCNFYYNGTKAWYKSGLSGSIKVNAPANWKKQSGSAHHSQYSSSEKSYWAYYTGKVAQYGDLYGGAVPVKLKTVLVQAGVVCSKTGYITTKNTAYEVSN